MEPRIRDTGLWFPNEEAKSRIYTCLREWILYTQLKPGQRLNERDLAERFGISRTPLREILQLLCQQGLLLIRPRQGVFVAPIETAHIREVFEVRLPLEKTVARLAAERAGEESLAELQDLADRSEQALRAGDYEQGIRLDAAFHDALSKATGNMVLRQTREGLHNICLRYWFLILDRYRPDEMDMGAHNLLLRAIRTRAPETAATIHGRHVSNFLHLIQDEP